MRDWNRSRIGSNRPGATRQDAQMEVRDMGMSTIQFRLAPPMKPVIEPASCQTSGVHQAHRREGRRGVGLSTT